MSKVNKQIENKSYKSNVNKNYKCEKIKECKYKCEKNKKWK